MLCLWCSVADAGPVAIQGNQTASMQGDTTLLEDGAQTQRQVDTVEHTAVVEAEIAIPADHHASAQMQSAAAMGTDCKIPGSSSTATCTVQAAPMMLADAIREDVPAAALAPSEHAVPAAAAVCDGPLQAAAATDDMVHNSTVQAPAAQNTSEVKMHSACQAPIDDSVTAKGANTPQLMVTSTAADVSPDSDMASVKDADTTQSLLQAMDIVHEGAPSSAVDRMSKDQPAVQQEGGVSPGYSIATGVAAHHQTASDPAPISTQPVAAAMSNLSSKPPVSATHVATGLVAQNSRPAAAAKEGAVRAPLKPFTSGAAKLGLAAAPISTAAASIYPSGQPVRQPTTASLFGKPAVPTAGNLTNPPLGKAPDAAVVFIAGVNVPAPANGLSVRTGQLGMVSKAATPVPAAAKWTGIMPDQQSLPKTHAVGMLSCETAAGTGIPVAAVARSAHRLSGSYRREGKLSGGKFVASRPAVTQVPFAGTQSTSSGLVSQLTADKVLPVQPPAQAQDADTVPMMNDQARATETGGSVAGVNSSTQIRPTTTPTAGINDQLLGLDGTADSSTVTTKLPDTGYTDKTLAADFADHIKRLEGVCMLCNVVHGCCFGSVLPLAGRAVTAH